MFYDGVIIAHMKRLIFLLFTLLLFCGCSGGLIGTNVEELLVAPQPDELHGAAFDAIKNHAGDHAVIITPTDGADTGALFVDDGSFSGEQSLITFYSNSNSGTDINLALLRKTDEGFTVHYATTGLGNDVEGAEFVYLETDAAPYLTVSYSGVTGNERYLAIYRYNEQADVIESVFAQDYRAMIFADIQGESEKEIVFALPSTREGSMNMRIISLADGIPVQLYLGTPNINIMEAKQLLFSQGDEDKYIAVDGLDAQNYSTADLIKFSSGEAVGILEQQQLLTHNVPLLQSFDIDGDGVVEQPALMTSPEGMDGSGYLMVGFYDISKDQQSPKYIGIVNTRLAFLVLIPPHWYNDISFVHKEDGFSVTDLNGTSILFTMDVTESTQGIEYPEGETEQVLHLGSFRIYATTYDQLTEYEQSFLMDGIQQMY